MEENNKINISDLTKIIDVINTSTNKVIIIWDKKIYNEDEQSKILYKTQQLNYVLIDCSISNLIKIIEGCKEIIKNESKIIDDGINKPLIILKEPYIKNEYIFDYPNNTYIMYKIIQDQLENNQIILLTKMETSYKEHIYLNINDFINNEFKINNDIDELNIKYLDEIESYSLNYLIPTFIEIMNPKVKYRIIQEKENEYILESKKHTFKILLINDLNNNDVDIFKYNLILEVNDYNIPTQSILKNQYINDIYQKYKNPLEELGK